MKIGDFELYRTLLLRHTGYSLTQEKVYLLDSRLPPVARRFGYPTLEALTLALRGIPDTALVNEVVEAMMPSDTSFFDDAALFAFLRAEVMPYFIKRRAREKDIRIWSAGCSTGQEPYSIAMMLKDMEKDMRGWGVDILATDISQNALRRARTAIYTQFEVQRGLPVGDLIAWFEELESGWRLSNQVSSLVTFEHFNLMDTMDDLGIFDLIVCRNVLEYLDPDARSTMLKRMAGILDEGGILILDNRTKAHDLGGLFKSVGDAPAVFGHSADKYPFESRQQLAQAGSTHD